MENEQGPRKSKKKHYDKNYSEPVKNLHRTLMFVFFRYCPLNKILLTKDQSKIKQSPFLLPLFFPIWIWPPNEPLLLELRFNAHIKHFLRTLAPLIH